MISYVNVEAQIFHYPWGRKTKWSGGWVCVNVKNGNPLPAAVSLAQINLHIICEFPMFPKKES